MRLTMILVVAAALAAPVAALADAAPTPASTANQICKLAKTQMGTLFATTYGTNTAKSNAFGQCVKKNTAAAQQDVTNAAKTCKAQQADANFATSHGGKTFNQFYGDSTSKGKGSSANAYGKCVSLAVNAAAGAQAASLSSAAKTCKAARKASTADFATKWGTASLAFGKCVSATAKATTK